MVLNNKYLRYLTELTCSCCLKCYSNLGRVPMFVIHTKNQPLDIFRLVAMPTFMVTFSILAM